LGLYPPGRILHLIRKYETRDTKNSDNLTSDYCIFDIYENDNKSFDELVVSSRMIQDHMPNVLIDSLKKVNY
jgi:hypothetical protein